MSKNLRTLICCILALVFVAGSVVAAFAGNNAAVAAEEASSEVESEVESEVTSEAPAVYKLGDVNRDGVVNLADARLTLRASAKLVALDAEQLILADVVKDGEVELNDARRILRVSIRLEPESVLGQAA